MVVVVVCHGKNQKKSLAQSWYQVETLMENPRESEPTQLKLQK